MGAVVKGQVQVVAKDGLKAGAYTLVLDFNALCDLEDDFPGLMDGDVKISGFKSVRRILHGGFVQQHPELSERDVGDIVQSIGLAEASEKLAEAMAASFPEAKGKPDPQ